MRWESIPFCYAWVGDKHCFLASIPGVSPLFLLINSATRYVRCLLILSMYSVLNTPETLNILFLWLLCIASFIHSRFQGFPSTDISKTKTGRTALWSQQDHVCVLLGLEVIGTIQRSLWSYKVIQGWASLVQACPVLPLDWTHLPRSQLTATQVLTLSERKMPLTFFISRYKNASE